MTWSYLVIIAPCMLVSGLCSLDPNKGDKSFDWTQYGVRLKAFRIKLSLVRESKQKLYYLSSIAL